jgi:hypothetical protein
MGNANFAMLLYKGNGLDLFWIGDFGLAKLLVFHSAIPIPNSAIDMGA